MPDAARQAGSALGGEAWPICDNRHMTSTPFSDLAVHPCVLLTTFRRNGEGVSTPVWVAPDGDRLLITTDPGSGKAKRLRHTGRVQLVACSASGAVREGATPVTAVAAVHDDAETLAVLDKALLSKYGLQYWLIRAGKKLRRRAAASVAVVVTAA